jgi:uncharacterized membrane protein YfcA
MHLEVWQLVLLCIAAFCAGFIDAIVGGGGLVQLPASLVILNSFPVVTVVGSLKIPAFCGTSFAAAQYLRQVKIKWRLMSVACTIAFFAAYAGSETLTHVSNSFMKPVLLVVLTAVLVYTYTRKNFGHHETKEHSSRTELFYTAIISLAIGFYDGFIGPGAGSFLILVFIAALGFDFLHASAHAKLVNLATNLGSITLFLFKGKIIWLIALPMAASNALGSIIGARLAIAKGNKFIRIFFLFVVTATLIRFAYDVFIHR